MMNYFFESKENIFVAAHRGFSARYPENTMLAFEKAIALCVDQIETDVRVTADGELVLIHDETVDRTTNGTGLVSEKSYAELAALDAGEGQRIPKFEELLALVKDHPTMTLDIELKEYPTEGREQLAYSVCDRVLALVDAYGFTDRIVINTFSGKLHEYIKHQYGKKYRRHVYYPVSCLGAVQDDPYDGAFCCCMFRSGPAEINLATPQECEAMASRGVEPWAGAAVKDARGVDLAIEAGATLITCNNPDEILVFLRERGRHQ